uniref:Uncharacterized protein LOC104265735 n=1 Tax=Phallusia mammillata TaxID=59560 RepID=A0A6F9DJK2_9ASCI|nr:uncharacterized protein LOC104265735 [Phallusia mammillata]
MGGIWERLIRSIRKILNLMLHESSIVSEDTLRTLMVEVENILNSRPLTPVTFSPSNDVPLTPNHILLQKPSPVMSPGQFDEKDNYTRRRWRQVQFLADEFWRRWAKEYLPTIALRQKWPDRRKNIEVGDIVLVVNESMPRRGWDLGRVINTYPDKHGVVRQVDVKTKSSIIKRPIAKLCLVVEASGSQLHPTRLDN